MKNKIMSLNASESSFKEDAKVQNFNQPKKLEVVETKQKQMSPAFETWRLISSVMTGIGIGIGTGGIAVSLGLGMGASISTFAFSSVALPLGVGIGAGAGALVGLAAGACFGPLAAFVTYKMYPWMAKIRRQQWGLE